MFTSLHHNSAAKSIIKKYLFNYQGASHNRFEHSLGKDQWLSNNADKHSHIRKGVSYLAAGVVEHFQHSQPELDITKEEAESVKIAG